MSGEKGVLKFKQVDGYYRPTPRQLTLAQKLGREVRDRLQSQQGVEISANSLAKNYSIDTLLEAVEALREGSQVSFE